MLETDNSQKSKVLVEKQSNNQVKVNVGLFYVFCLAFAV